VDASRSVLASEKISSARLLVAVTQQSVVIQLDNRLGQNVVFNPFTVALLICQKNILHRLTVLQLT